jgi:hypothetical protein
MFPDIYHFPATGRGINAGKKGIYRAGNAPDKFIPRHTEPPAKKGDFPFLSSWPNHWN